MKRSEAIRKVAQRGGSELRNQVKLVNARLSLTSAQVESMQKSIVGVTRELQKVQARCGEIEDALSHQPGAALRLNIKRLGSAPSTNPTRWETPGACRVRRSSGISSCCCPCKVAALAMSFSR